MIQTKCSKIDKRPIGTTISGTFLHADPEYVLLKISDLTIIRWSIFLIIQSKKKNNFIKIKIKNGYLFFPMKWL
jgi:hypothetical protein